MTPEDRDIFFQDWTIVNTRYMPFDPRFIECWVGSEWSYLAKMADSSGRLSIVMYFKSAEDAVIYKIKYADRVL